MSEIAEELNGTVEDLFGDQTEEAVETAPAPEAEVAPAEEEWNFEAAGRDLFVEDEDEVPDFNALAEQELAEEDDELVPTEYDDEQTRALKKQAAALKKRAEYHERRHLETARKSWESDVKGQSWGEFAGDLSKIQANSHREFLRQAKGQAKSNYEVLKPHFAKLEAEKARIREVGLQEARVVAESAWGKPSVATVHVPPSDVEKTNDQMQRALARRDMYGITKAMIDSGQI